MEEGDEVDEAIVHTTMGTPTAILPIIISNVYRMNFRRTTGFHNERKGIVNPVLAKNRGAKK